MMNPTIAKIYTLILLLALLIIFAYAPLPVSGAVRSVQLQAELTQDAYQLSRSFLLSFPVREVSLLLVAIGLLLIWKERLQSAWKRLHKFMFYVTLLLTFVMASACRPVSVVTKEPNEVLYAVPVTGSSENQTQIDSDLFENATQVMSTDIEVDRTYVSTNYILGISTAGYYRPAMRIYVVNTTPVTVNWVEYASAIPVESSESAGFSVPIIMSVYLSETKGEIAGTDVVCEAANRYLNIYGRKVDVAVDQVEIEARPLQSVLDTEVKGMLARELSGRFAAISIGEAVANKASIIAQSGALVQAHFSAQGICISSIGTTSGLLYDDEGYQAQINEAANRSLDEDAARANATTTAIYAGASANSTRIAIEAVATSRAVERQSIVQQAEAEATAEIIAAQSAAEAQRLMGEAIRENPALIELEYAERYGGGCTQNCFGDNSGVVPFYNVNPQPAPTTSAP